MCIRDRDNVIEIVQDCGGIDYTKTLAEGRAESATNYLLQNLPKSEYRDSLEKMVEFSIKRTN